MRTTNPKLYSDLLETGKREFLTLGYRDASLRHIAASLGVTTGAIYGYFADKEALFDALVAQPAKSWRIATGRYSRPLLSRAWRSRYETSPKCLTKRPGGCWTSSTTTSTPSN